MGIGDRATGSGWGSSVGTKKGKDVGRVGWVTVRDNKHRTLGPTLDKWREIWWGLRVGGSRERPRCGYRRVVQNDGGKTRNIRLKTSQVSLDGFYI